MKKMYLIEGKKWLKELGKKVLPGNVVEVY